MPFISYFSSNSFTPTLILTLSLHDALPISVNEENAAGGRVVTAPTNGAAGIIPAVLFFATTYIEGVDPDEVAVRFLLPAGAIGSLYKEHASISGAAAG